MIALYRETRDIARLIERLLTNADIESTGSRRAFRRRVQRASVGIASLEECENEDIEWLHAVFDHGHSGPSCVVVTPLSLARLQRLRRIESTRFHVVWAEEVEDRLVQLLDEIEPWHRDPLRLLGHRLLRDFSLHWSLVKAIDHICSVTAHPSRTPPTHSVIELAERIRLPPDTLRRSAVLASGFLRNQAADNGNKEATTPHPRRQGGNGGDMSDFRSDAAGPADRDELFAEALGLQWPWYVERRAFDATKRRLDLHLNFEAGGTFRCGACGTPGCKAYDTVLKRWRHLDFFHYQTFVNAPSPRVECPHCGVRQAHLSWARRRRRLTVPFEEFVVNLAREMPVRAVSRIVGEHDTRLWRIVNEFMGGDPTAPDD